jgi:hypothetical protein
MGLVRIRAKGTVTSFGLLESGLVFTELGVGRVECGSELGTCFTGTGTGLL